MTNRINTIKQYGQKIWLDNLSNKLLKKLDYMINEDKIAGLTSNPTIFYQAIKEDVYYQNKLSTLKEQITDLEARYEALVLPDVVAACDIFMPLYLESNKVDGYISFEVSPTIAHDIDKTVEHALRLWRAINRPNLMIKIPATFAGIKALEKLIALGINVNVTLIFSFKQLTNTWQAYVQGLKTRFEQGLSLSGVRAVASFFLSRIDTLIDDKLPKHLQGRIAINLAKKAYLEYERIFTAESFTSLNNATGQFLLWASTGTKNPNYSDVMYLEELIGSNTINTVPQTTFDAFLDHGIAGDNLTKNIEQANDIVDEANKYVNLEEIGEVLQQDGLDSFSKSFASLIELMK